jgi:hypothetical protein
MVVRFLVTAANWDEAPLAIKVKMTQHNTTGYSLWE